MRYFDDCMTLEELKARYKQWVLKLHPDRNPDNPNAEADFKDMQEQYECREAELKGDYSKSRRQRERERQREQERERERQREQERERKEREQRKVEAAIEQARKNKNRSYREFKPGDYIYARLVNLGGDANEQAIACMFTLLRWAIESGMKEECVVKIETIVDLFEGNNAKACVLNGQIPEGVWGGWEVLQGADPANGIRKAKRVAKVVMFRSEFGYVLGNPMGDQTISDYYLPTDLEGVFTPYVIHDIRSQIEHERQEKKRMEEERRAKLLEEQKPLLLEWQDKLIELSRGLSAKERETVAVSNLKTMLKAKFPGATFKVAADKYGGYYDIHWEDGPTTEEVFSVTALFDCNPTSRDNAGVTPWKERYGEVLRGIVVRKMSVLTKARILQQLGQVTMVFRNAGYYDEVEVTGFDMQMLEALAGVQFGDMNATHCQSQYRNNMYYVRVENAVRFIFNNTSYYKPRRSAKRKAATA